MNVKSRKKSMFRKIRDFDPRLRPPRRMFHRRGDGFRGRHRNRYCTTRPSFRRATYKEGSNAVKATWKRPPRRRFPASGGRFRENHVKEDSNAVKTVLRFRVKESGPVVIWRGKGPVKAGNTPVRNLGNGFYELQFPVSDHPLDITVTAE